MALFVKTCSFCGKVIEPGENWGGIGSKYYHHPDDEKAQDCYSLATWAETEAGSENNLSYPLVDSFTLTLPLTDVDPKLLDALLGPEPRPAFGEKTWILKAGDHMLEVWDPEVTEYHDGRELRFETKFNMIRVLCGAHDKKGNHIARE